ncbi:MAG: transketolase [Elusimicrobiota bacterium]
MDVDGLHEKARQIRATCVKMAHHAKEGHLSSALSPVDPLVALFYSWLRLYPKEPRHPERDRFILSKGHGCSALYAIMADLGFFPVELLRDYGREGSPLASHPCAHALPALEASSGSLGIGLGLATGMLYGLRLKGSAARAVVLLGDGECNEGSVWEAAMFAAAQRLEKLLAVVDYNGIQAVGRSDELMGGASLEEKFRAFGWAARTVDGSDIGAFLAALKPFPFEEGKPSAVIVRTRLGVSFMEGDVLWHYRVPSDDDLRRSLEELAARPLGWEA